MLTMLKARVGSVQLWVGIAVTAASFALYLSTLAPTLTWGWENKGVDGGEFLAAAHTLGIPHPPGYPTYTLLLKSFTTLVPLGDIAYRGNLLSAILASATVFTLYQVVLRFCRHLQPASAGLAVTSAALASVVFATSPLFWSQAVITEVYTLNALFAAVLLLIATDLALPRGATPAGSHTANDSTAPSLSEDPQPQRAGPTSPATYKLALFGLLLGLGLGNHLTLLAVAVPMLYWLWRSLGRRTLVSPWLIGSLVLGIAVYAYLPIRASQNPPVSWGEADTFRGAVWMLTARPYQEYVFGVGAQRILDCWWLGCSGRIISWTEVVFSQFNPLGLFLGLMAIGPLRHGVPGFFFPAVASMTIISIYTITYNTFDFEVLMIPAFLLFSVWIGTGFFWITSTWLPGAAAANAESSGGLVLANTLSHSLVLGVLGFLLLPGVSVALNYGSQNLRHDHTARDHASGILEAVPDGAVVLSGRENDVFSLWYMRYVEEPERDVAIIATPLLQFDWYLQDIHRMFPERIPAMEAAPGILESMRRIVEHNMGGDSKVFLTYRDRFIDAAFDLEQAQNTNVYEASPK